MNTLKFNISHFKCNQNKQSPSRYIIPRCIYYCLGFSYSQRNENHSRQGLFKDYRPNKKRLFSRQNEFFFDFLCVVCTAQINWEKMLGKKSEFQSSASLSRVRDIYNLSQDLLYSIYSFDDDLSISLIQ